MISTRWLIKQFHRLIIHKYSPSSMNHAKPTSFHRSQFIPSIYLFIVTCNLDFNDDNVKFDWIESSILLAYNNDNDNNTATIVETKTLDIISKGKWCPSYILYRSEPRFLEAVVNFYNETASLRRDCVSPFPERSSIFLHLWSSTRWRLMSTFAVFSILPGDERGTSPFTSQILRWFARDD